MTAAGHWDDAYAGGESTVSWHQERPEPSLSAIAELELGADVPIVDVGGGSSTLAGALLAAGHSDLTVMDISRVALDLARDRLGAAAESVTWVCADLLEREPARAYGLWHDRAVLHFLVEDDVRSRYVKKLAATVEHGGHAIIGTFAEDGADRCSGLPVRRADADDLGALLAPALTVVRSWRHDHRTPEPLCSRFAGSSPDGWGQTERVTNVEALGLHDPGAPDAAARLELLEYLVSLGATTEELLAHRDGLPALAAVLTIRGGPVLTLAEAIARSGVSEDCLRRLVRAAGFADPAADDSVFASAFADLVASMTAAEDLFGEDAVVQLVRVMGASMARVADAVVSAFLVNVEPAAREEDPGGLGVARANAEAAALLPLVASMLDTLLRQHLLAARRTLLGDATGAGYEAQVLTVGFVDLVGSTALAQRLTARELGAVLTRFENQAADTVRARGGRVIKLIGDEILYTAPTAASACDIALTLAADLADDPEVPQVRGGLAAGDVLLRDGDVFGPVVNLAARAVKLAPPGRVIAPATVAQAAGRGGEPIGDVDLRGSETDAELWLLVPD